MKIEAITICKDYADFLEHTLPENLAQLDRLVVVTHPDDKRTKGLCQKFGVDVIETTVFHDSGDKFNKGRAINLGLSHLRHDGWLIHMDSDVLLPDRFRAMVNQAKLDPGFIYGADRLNCRNFDNWTKHKHKNKPQHRWRFLVTPTDEFPVGSRLVHQEYGYCPIGYFQMWHASMRRNYPIVHGSAEHGDVLFAAQWPRERRALLPEFFVYHLESEGSFGANWEGRNTPEFGPSGDADQAPKNPQTERKEYIK